MSIESIIQTLIATQSITSANVVTLRTKTNNKEFLETLIQIYEKKALHYLSACMTKMLNQLRTTNQYPQEHLMAMSAQHIIEYANNSFLATNKAYLLPSLEIILKTETADLAVSLGVATVSKTANQPTVYLKLKDQITDVFVKYFARQRLNIDVINADLQEICQAIQAEDANMFPMYLLQSLTQQNAIQLAINNAVSGQITAGVDVDAIWAKELSQGVREYSDLFNQCIKGSIFYLGSVLNSSLTEEYRNEYFAHLSNNTTALQFVDMICREYINRMSSEENVRGIYAKNSENMVSVYRNSCMANLPLLGIKVVTSVAAIDARKNQLAEALQTLLNQKSAINTAAQERIGSISSQAAQNAATINGHLGSLDTKTNEFKQQMMVDIQQKRDTMKPAWTISTGPQLSGPPNPEFNVPPGPSFKF